MEIVAFESCHIDQMADFGNQEDIIRPMIGLVRDARYEDLGPAFSAKIGGEFVGCAGLVEVTQYRAYAWAIVSKQKFTRNFLGIHRAVARFLDQQSYRRIDAQVAFRDTDGHRWMRLLGFQREVFCRPWFMPDGSSISEYARFI